MPEALRRKLVVLEESALMNMALNTGLVKEFPFLQSLSRVVRGEVRRSGGCGSCSKASQERSVVFAAAKQTIASMDSSKKRRLKELLNAEQARVTYRNNSGKVIQLTF